MVDDGAEGFIVTRAGEQATVERDSFVAGVAGRSGPGLNDEAVARLLDLGY